MDKLCYLIDSLHLRKQVSCNRKLEVFPVTMILKILPLALLLNLNSFSDFALDLEVER